jgi:peptide/nickel transport system ATP-binding protein
MPASELLLRIRGLSLEYTGADHSTISALRNVSLELRRQETLGILGESGSGKSSLSHAILRLLPANGRIVSGEIEYRGKNVLSLSARELRHVRGAEIALVAQEPALALNPVLTIERQVIDVLRAHRRVSKQEAMEQTRAMLREVGFSDPERIGRAYPHQLSGGQRQRAAIAQALICGPSLLIADEPLSSLDAVTQGEILELLKKLKNDLHLAIIFVTHNAGVLSSLADRIAVMGAGQVQAHGTLDQLAQGTEASVGGLIFPERAFTERTSATPARARSASTEPLVRLQKVNKHFFQHRFLSRRTFQVQALKDIDLEIPQGASVAVIGRSGSGKTTLARCIAGFERPDQGKISLAETASKHRGDVQLIFQDAGTALNPRFTAAEAIREPLDIAHQFPLSQRQERALELMEETGLNVAWAARKVGEFSGGQRQRIAIARALAAEARMLIFDESLSGLDLPLQAQILRMLMDLQARHGLTYLHITHDLSFLAFFADQVVVMDQGAIVERATPSALLESSEPATRALIEASERLHVAGLEVAI